MVSDVHGTADALAAAGDGADMLICLGDMLLFLDYADHTQGIFAELYGAEHAREYIDLRTARRFDEARQLTAGIAARLTADRGTDLRTLTEQAIRRQYAALFGALAEPAYLTYGNVDVPRMWNGYLKPGHHVLDGGRVEVGGRHLRVRRRRADLPVPDAERDPAGGVRRQARRRRARSTCCARISRLPSPNCSTTRWPGGWRRAATALLDVIRRTQPRYAFFGHVHNPLARRVRVGRTECVNVGHFRATRRRRMWCSCRGSVCRYEPSQARDPIGDFQRWLMKAGARSLSREVADRVKSTLGGGRQRASTPRLGDRDHRDRRATSRRSASGARSAGRPAGTGIRRHGRRRPRAASWRGWATRSPGSPGTRSACSRRRVRTSAAARPGWPRRAARRRRPAS